MVFWAERVVNLGVRFTHHWYCILRTAYLRSNSWSSDLKKKKPRRENLDKIYNQITDLDEYPRIEKHAGEKKAKK